MDQQNNRIVEIQDRVKSVNIDPTKFQLTRKQKELLQISDQKYYSSALNTFKLFEQESEKQIQKVKEFTKDFENMKEQSQSLSFHISKLEQSSTTIQMLLDSKINQARQMNEQYNNLSLHLEQTLNLMMPQIQQSREQICKLNKFHILKQLPQILLRKKFVLVLIRTLYNETNLEQRNLLQYLNNPEKLLQDWVDFNIDNITEEQIRDIRAEFNPEDDQGRYYLLFEVSIFNLLKIINQYNEIRPTKAQLLLLKQNIQDNNKSIQENEQEFSRIDSELKELKSKLIELNVIMNENQSKYDFQVVQRSAFVVLREIIQNFEMRVRKLEMEIENLDILAFVECAYNQQFKKYESKQCESLIQKLDITIALAKPIEYKLNYCYQNSDQLVIFVFDPYQVVKIMFRTLSQAAQSVFLATCTEQQIAQSSQIVHFINNQQELSQINLRGISETKRNLFFIFDRDLLEQLKKASMDNYVNLDLNEQDLTFIYSIYSINQQYTIDQQKQNDKFKDQVNILLNKLNNNEFELIYQLLSDFKVSSNTDSLYLQQLDEELPQFCSRLFFLIQEKTKTNFNELADQILNVYQSQPTTPIIQSFKIALDYARQYMTLSQTLVHRLDDRSEQTLLGFLIHKINLKNNFVLSEEEQQKLQQCYVFCCKILNLRECNIYEFISQYIEQKNIYNQSIAEIVQELDSASKIFQFISKQREMTNILQSVMENNENLKIAMLKEEQQIEEQKVKIGILTKEILDNGDVIRLKQNQLNDLDKKLANQDRNLIYSEIHYLTHTVNPDQIVQELFGLLMVLRDQDSTWASIKNNTNSKVKINNYNKYETKKISNNFVDQFNIFNNCQEKAVLIQQSNNQTNRLYRFLEFLRSKYDFYQEKLQLQDQLVNCRQILKQNSINLQNEKYILAQQEKTRKSNQSIQKQNQQLIQLEVKVLDCLNNNSWFEDHIKQIHQKKQSTLNFIIQQQILVCVYQSCEIQFQYRIQMKQDRQTEQNHLEFQLQNSGKYMDFIQNIQCALQFEANLSLQEYNLELRYFQDIQIFKFKLMQKINFIDVDNIKQDYLNLFEKEQQLIIVKQYQNIKMNIKKVELLKQPLLEFSSGLAIILIQSHNLQYSLVLNLVSECFQQFYLNQTFSRNEFLKKLLSQASTKVKVDCLGKLYIQIFILFIYVYQPKHISKVEMAEIVILNFAEIPILGQITPLDNLASITSELDIRLENIFGADRFKFCDL